jgi:hypothetical protein
MVHLNNYKYKVFAARTNSHGHNSQLNLSDPGTGSKNCILVFDIFPNKDYSVFFSFDYSFCIPVWYIMIDGLRKNYAE